MINAPAKYVYDWATDYTEEDTQITGGTDRRIILLKNKTKVIFASFKTGQDGQPKLAVRIVTLYPQRYAWHLDYFGEEDLETGEYKLVRLGRQKTRLDMSFNNKWKVGNGPSRKDHEDHMKEMWDKYAAALEADYSSGKPAKS